MTIYLTNKATSICSNFVKKRQVKYEKVVQVLEKTNKYYVIFTATLHKKSSNLLVFKH